MRIDRYESDQMAVLDRLAGELAGSPAGTTLDVLSGHVAGRIDNDLERAVRAWSISDPAARAVQERLDDARLGFLRQLWTRLVGDRDLAHTAALVPHLIAVGASVAHPRLTTAELAAVFDLLAALGRNVTAES